jgi:MFS family permease
VLAALCGFLLKESEPWRALRRTRPPEHLGHEMRQLLAPANRTDFLVGATIFGTMLVGLWATFSWLPTWAQSLSGPGAERQQGSGLVVVLLGLGGIAGSAVSGFIANAVGRKRSLLITFGGCLVASFLLFKTNDAITPVVYAETAFLALFFGISQGILTTYIPELFPTPIRATATGICFNAGRLVTAGAVFFVGILVPVLCGYGNAVFAFSGVYVLGFIATLFGQETKGKAL